MPIKYHVQQLPQMRQGEQAQYPVPETYTQFDNKRMVARIAMESGIQDGAILGTLNGLPKALKAFLLEGHSCKIDGLGTFSLSLEFDKNRQVSIKRLNLKIDQEFMQELQKEAEFVMSTPDVVQAAPSKGHRDEHFALLAKWLDHHTQITLQEYANLINVSTATASRELNYFASNSQYGITGSGPTNRKCWIKTLTP